jgi:hypothetical protein
LADFILEKTVPAELLNDVWIQTGVDADGEAIIERLMTNTPVLNDDGSPMIDQKTKQPVTKTEIHQVPVSVAKKMFNNGTARRADPLPV